MVFQFRYLALESSRTIVLALLHSLHPIFI
jgi:hypothetical protein